MIEIPHLTSETRIIGLYLLLIDTASGICPNSHCNGPRHKPA
jgi:hypothetical protein